MMSLKIAFRNIWRHKIRSGVTVFAMVFGCSAIIFVGGFFEDIYVKLQENSIYSQTGHIQIASKGFFSKGAVDPFQYFFNNHAEVAELVLAIPGVQAVSPEMNFAGLLTNGENSVSCLATAKDPSVLVGNPHAQKHPREEFSLRNGFAVVAGERLSAGDRDSIELGRGLAEALNLKPGDDVILLARSQSGSINGQDVGVRGIFVSGTQEVDENLLRVPLAAAQSLLRSDGVQSLVVYLQRTQDTARVKSELDRLFKERGWDFETKTWEELSDFYVKTRNLFERWFFLLKMVITVIVVLSIYNTMNMVVLERTAEIGTLMAMGTKRRGVRTIFLLEGGLLGLMGGFLGVVVGSGLTAVVGHWGIVMPLAPGFSTEWLSQPLVVQENLMFSFGLAISTALVSSIIPAGRASRIEIAEALRYAA